MLKNQVNSRKSKKNAGKVSFNRVFKLFIEKIECVVAMYLI